MRTSKWIAVRESGLPTHRVTLEITIDADQIPTEWPWDSILGSLVHVHKGESVRVVEEAAIDAGWAERLEADRDAAIREREELRTRLAALEPIASAHRQAIEAAEKFNAAQALKHMDDRASLFHFCDVAASAMHSGTAAMLRPIVNALCDQRDKYKARVAELEAENGPLGLAATMNFGEWKKAEARVAELEEAIARAGQSGPPQAPQPPKCTERDNGVRTDWVVLEITREAWRRATPTSPDNWAYAAREAGITFLPGESVRVVEEVAPAVHRGSGVFDSNGDEVPWQGVVAALTAERDAAIRERDELRSQVQILDEGQPTAPSDLGVWCTAKDLSARCNELAARLVTTAVRASSSEARVASLESQLESVACRAATAEMALESAPAASEWRILKVGETVEPGDEMSDDLFMPWRDAGPCVGQEVASGPIFFRRRVPAPAASVNSSGILTSSPAASGAAGTEVVEFWGVRAKQSMAVPPGCASPRRVQSQPFQVFASEREAQAEADRCGGVVFAIPGSEPAAPAASNSSGILTSSPAASGAAGTEAVAVQLLREVYEQAGNEAGPIKRHALTPQVRDDIRDFLKRWKPSDAAPQAAPGWLTAEERELIAGITDDDDYTEEGQNIAKALLARSSPPEVVRPDQEFFSHSSVVRDAKWLAALAAAGVPCKEVG